MINSIQEKRTIVTMLFFSIYLLFGCNTVHASYEQNKMQQKNITSDNFKAAEVLSNTADSGSKYMQDRKVVVFYNQYCSHCKAWLNSTGLTYEKEAPSRFGASAPSLTLYDLSVRKNFKIYQEMLSSGKLSKSIDAVPTFLVVDSDSVEIKRYVGAMEKDAFYNFVMSDIENA
ncbi:MAG: hypothetical protein VX737_01245 [Pseudomonadota bacterium]|nr:hypothetical protein [Pseudomonadota bacterium]